MQTQATELIDDGARRDRRGRRRTPLRQRARMVEAFHASGLTQAVFARREGLNAKTLSHWLKPAAGGAARPPSLRFAQVSVPVAHAAAAPSLEVTLPDGTIVRGSDAVGVAELVRALRA